MFIRCRGACGQAWNDAALPAAEAAGVARSSDGDVHYSPGGAARALHQPQRRLQPRALHKSPRYQGRILRREVGVLLLDAVWWGSVVTVGGCQSYAVYFCQLAARLCVASIRWVSWGGAPAGTRPCRDVLSPTLPFSERAPCSRLARVLLYQPAYFGTKWSFEYSFSFNYTSQLLYGKPIYLRKSWSLASSWE